MPIESLQGELLQFNREEQLTTITNSLETGTTSLVDTLGPFRVFRGGQPGEAYLSGFHNQSAASMTELGFQRQPRKYEPEYAEYLHKSLGPMELVMMIGDSLPDFKVASHLRARGLNTHSVIVNPKVAYEFAGSDYTEQLQQQGYYFHEEFQSWFGTSWETLGPAIRRFTQQADTIVNKNHVVVLSDVDKTLIGPKTLADEQGIQLETFIDQSREMAVSAYAHETVFQEAGGWKNHAVELWRNKYSDVRKLTSFWDDEDTNTILTGLTFFGIETPESISSMSSTPLQQYLNEKLTQVTAIKAQEIPPSNSGIPQDILQNAWTNFVTSLKEVKSNVEKGLATPFERFRLYEAAALHRFFDSGKITFNRSILEVFQYALEQQWRTFGVSDKPDAAIGLPLTDVLGDQYPNTILARSGPVVGHSIKHLFS